jgi:hypothetical protein
MTNADTADPAAATAANVDAINDQNAGVGIIMLTIFSAASSLLSQIALVLVRLNHMPVSS